MQITIDKTKQPKFETATECDRWCRFQQKHFVCIEMTAMERQNLLQELRDVLKQAASGKDWMFGVQTRMCLFELYKAMGGEEF